ncbi:unnamed protein product [Moneuplotes crassus]|uniref:FCP1 homology domain-containing protein n=1 Tax=Euplotes crassus TaxID=5936 RepID=A0AAD2D640_EUPCR|nr:unnamed protein product [Moneuplotes crassus]
MSESSLKLSKRLLNTKNSSRKCINYSTKTEATPRPKKAGSKKANLLNKTSNLLKAVNLKNSLDGQKGSTEALSKSSKKPEKRHAKPKAKLSKTKGAKVPKTQGNMQIGVTQANGLENEIVKIIEARITLDKQKAQRASKKVQPGAVIEVKNQSDLVSLLPDRNPDDQGKKTLVLDLDETLIHSVFKPVDDADIIIKIPDEVTDHEGNKYTLTNDIYVYKRPGVDMFLKRLSRYFELVIFTASIDKYANPVINALDTQKLCQHRLYREHCTYMYSVFIKDLTRLGRKMEDILILDNSPISYLFQKQNALPIKTWLDDRNDIELYKYLRPLEYLSRCEDVRNVITQIVDQESNQIDFELFDKIASKERNSGGVSQNLLPSTIGCTESSKRYSSETRDVIQNKIAFKALEQPKPPSRKNFSKIRCKNHVNMPPDLDDDFDEESTLLVKKAESSPIEDSNEELSQSFRKPVLSSQYSAMIPKRGIELSPKENLSTYSHHHKSSIEESKDKSSTSKDKSKKFMKKSTAKRHEIIKGGCFKASKKDPSMLKKLEKDSLSFTEGKFLGSHKSSLSQKEALVQSVYHKNGTKGSKPSRSRIQGICRNQSEKAKQKKRRYEETKQSNFLRTLEPPNAQVGQDVHPKTSKNSKSNKFGLAGVCSGIYKSKESLKTNTAISKSCLNGGTSKKGLDSSILADLEDKAKSRFIPNSHNSKRNEGHSLQVSEAKPRSAKKLDMKVRKRSLKVAQSLKDSPRGDVRNKYTATRRRMNISSKKNSAVRKLTSGKNKEHSMKADSRVVFLQNNMKLMVGSKKAVNRSQSDKNRKSSTKSNLSFKIPSKPNIKNLRQATSSMQSSSRSRVRAKRPDGSMEGKNFFGSKKNEARYKKLKKKCKPAIFMNRAIINLNNSRTNSESSQKRQSNSRERSIESAKSNKSAGYKSVKNGTK